MHGQMVPQSTRRDHEKRDRSDSSSDSEHEDSSSSSQLGGQAMEEDEPQAHHAVDTSVLGAYPHSGSLYLT
jgi:hypothetical protein